MAKAEKPIFFDADAVIHLHEWGVWGKLVGKLGPNVCVSEYVAKKEVKGYRERGTYRWFRVNLPARCDPSGPRIIGASDLSPQEHVAYLQHFAKLVGAGPGERESMALAWSLEYDFCCYDSEAQDMFREHRPEGIASCYVLVTDLLRRIGLIAS